MVQYAHLNAGTSFGNVFSKPDDKDDQRCHYKCYNSCLDQRGCDKKEPEQAQQCKVSCLTEPLVKCDDVLLDDIDLMCPPPGYMPKYPGDYTEPKTTPSAPPSGRQLETKSNTANQLMAMYCNGGLMPAIYTILLMIIVFFLFIIMICGVACTIMCARHK